MVLRLSAFADEASANFAEQIAALREERIPFIELRGLDGKNVADLTDAEAETYAEMLTDHILAKISTDSLNLNF